MHPIQTEIRISDILALLKTGEVKFFICHNVAFMMKHELEKNTDFAKKLAECRREFHDLPDLFNSGYYYYIDDFRGMALCTQVMNQLNFYIAQIFPGEPTFDHWLSDSLLDKCVKNSDVMRYCELQLMARVGLLERILEIDPEAVIPISL